MKVARALGVMVATMALASSAQATPITVNFSGTADLSPFGASASSTVQGSATWDPISAPLLSGGNFAYYPADVNISINSVDYTSSIDIPAVIRIVNASFGDSFSIEASFSPFLDLGPDPDDLYLFGGFLNGPTSMFSSTVLPANLDFLSSVTGGQSAFIAPYFPPFGSNTSPSVGGTFAVVAPPATPVLVPEPSSMLLLTSSLFGLLCRSRRNRNEVRY